MAGKVCFLDWDVQLLGILSSVFRDGADDEDCLGCVGLFEGDVEAIDFIPEGEFNATFGFLHAA